MRGGKYLAEERGAFDPEEAPAATEVTPQTDALARAPLYEIAAHHDGQPATAWLSYFMREWNAEA